MILPIRARIIMMTTLHAIAELPCFVGMDGLSLFRMTRRSECILYRAKMHC